MKHFVKCFLVALAVISVLCCCAKPENSGSKEETSAPTDITLSQETFEAAQAGGSITLTVTAPTRPTISAVPAWITMPDGTYNSKTYKISYNVKVAENTSTDGRSATITIKAGSLSKDFKVTQPGKEAQDSTPKEMTLDKHAVTIRQAGGQASVIVTSPLEAAVADVPEWLEVSNTDFNNYKMKFTFRAAENDSYDERIATIKVSAGSFVDQITVTQEAKFKDPDAIDNTAWRRGMELGLGWNMGNHMDAINNGVSSETAWGNPKATQATFTGLKAKGFSSVRIPITWAGHIGAAPDYKIEDAWMNRVAEIVGYAKTAGLNVIINTHHDEDHGDGMWQNLKGAVDSESVNTKVKEEISAVWTQIAVKFKDEGDYLMMESFNELIYGDEWYSSSNTQKKCNVINEWNQVFVDAVRAAGGNNATRWLGVPGYAASPNYLTYLAVPNDSARKTMLAFHCYDPYDYTIGAAQLADWGHTGSAYTNGENEIKKLFKGIYENYIAKDIPIYMGEFGCSMRDKNAQYSWAFYLYYLEYVVKCARTYGIAPFLWDNGAEGVGREKHPYINHGTGDYMATGKEPVETMVKAWSVHSNDYNLQTVYDSAPVF